MIRRIPAFLPGLVLLLHALIFGEWIVDDAGISFAYARNLAFGHGLVATPGSPPVEGYSNPTWVFLLAPFFTLRLFDPVLTPKLLGAASALVGLVAVHRALAPRVGHWASAWALLLASISTPFAFWAVAGLENGLLAGLLGLLFYVCASPRGLSGRSASHAAILAVAIGWTRPDGILWAAAFPATLLIHGFAGRRRRPWARDLGIFCAGFGTLYGIFLLARRAWFGEWLPNTYYAKGGAGVVESAFGTILLQRQEVDRFMDLVGGTFEVLGPAMVVATLLGFGVMLGTRRRGSEALWTAGAFLSIAIVEFLLLPPDWMLEFRFGTPFALLVGPFLVLLGKEVGRALGVSGRVAAIAGVVVLGILAPFHWSGSHRTKVLPPASSVEGVASFNGRRFDHLAAWLGLSDASVLVNGLGGTLYYTDLHTYDIPGLCDPTIARTFRRDPEKLRDYLLQEAKPTIISLGFWAAERVRLDLHPAFTRDYVPIIERVGQSSLGRGAVQMVPDGLYVRREVAAGREEEMIAEWKVLQRLPGPALDPPP